MNLTSIDSARMGTARPRAVVASLVAVVAAAGIASGPVRRRKDMNSFARAVRGRLWKVVPVVVLALLGVFPATGQAAGTRVGVVGYCTFGEEQSAANALTADGRFGSVAAVDGDATQPSGAALSSSYDVVVSMTSSACYPDTTQLVAGDTALNDFVAAGGRLVMAGFGFQQIGFGPKLFAPGLSPLTKGPGNYVLPGAIDVAGASTTGICGQFAAGIVGPVSSSFASQTTLAPGATLCMSYAVGLPMLAVNAANTICAFNSFPIADLAQRGYARLFGNVVAACAPPVDTTGPETTITANPTDPSNSASPSFSFSGDDNGGTGVASFKCKLDSGSFAACTSPQSYSGLSDGSHTVQVQAIDVAGNVDPTPASFTWTVDTTPPDTTIGAHPANPNNNAVESFSFSGDDGSGTGVASFECELDGGQLAACINPQSYPGLADGSHTFQVRAVDAAGNLDPTPASFIWTVDTTGPTLNPTVTPNPVSLGGTATASAGATDASGVASSNCGPIDSSTAGVKSVTCAATDTAGNSSSTPVSYTVKYRFLGFESPIPQSSYKAGSTIPVKFALANSAGTRITDSAAQALAAGCFVQVRLDAASPTVCATYDTRTKTFQANVKVAKGMLGANHVNVDVYAPNGSGLVQTETEPITIKATVA